MQAYDLSLAYRSFPLHPDVPPEGLSLRKLLASRGVSLEAAHQSMRGLLEGEGLEYRPQDTSYGTRLAQELGKWGEHEGKHEIHDALFRANFVDGVNLSKTADLARVAERVGLDAAEAQRVLSERTFRSEVDADWERARQYGITGVPTFVAGNRGVVGAQPYEALEQLVQTAGAHRRAAGINRG